MDYSIAEEFPTEAEMVADGYEPIPCGNCEFTEFRRDGHATGRILKAWHRIGDNYMETGHASGITFVRRMSAREMSNAPNRQSNGSVSA